MAYSLLAGSPTYPGMEGRSHQAPKLEEQAIVRIHACVHTHVYSNIQNEMEQRAGDMEGSHIKQATTSMS